MIKLTQIRNFYHTFGYLIISNSISDNAINLLRHKILNLALPFLDSDVNNRRVLNRNFIFHKVLESNTDVLDWFLNESYLKIAKFLLGENMALFNSDANIFLRGAKFHRDHASVLPSLKILSYLQNSESINNSGDLLVIPGSHHVTDQYSSYLTANSSWPSGQSFQENFNNISDNSLLPLSQRIFDGSQFPSHQIKVNKNDLIFFDNRLLHTTIDHFSPFVRMNFSVFFIANPIDINETFFIKNSPNSTVNNELDEFFDIISKHEDCRYHNNLSLDKYTSLLRNNLYFSKFGYTNEEPNIYPSGTSQLQSRNFHLRQFISQDLLF